MKSVAKWQKQNSVGERNHLFPFLMEKFKQIKITFILVYRFYPLPTKKHFYTSDIHYVWKGCNFVKKKKIFTILQEVICLEIKMSIFSSPWPKAQVSISDQNFVRCRSCRKHFTFSYSSPEPLRQFQPNLAQSILLKREFKFVQIKGSAFLQGKIMTKIHWQI